MPSSDIPGPLAWRKWSHQLFGQLFGYSLGCRGRARPNADLASLPYYGEWSSATQINSITSFAVEEPNLNTLQTRTAAQAKSFWQFLCLWVIAVGIALAGVMFFPNEQPGALIGRAMLAACSVALLLFGSTTLLRRDGFPTDALGLKLTPQHAKGFVLGVAGGVLFIALMAAALAVQVPFHWEMGLLSLSRAALSAHTYFWTGFGEELLFRGYALIALSRYCGPRKAVWALALPFGLFHLPGMGMGMAAAKMIATTSAMSLVFSYSFLATGTLWTAVGLHAAGNVCLHTLTGLDGGAKATLWKPIFGLWPTGYDAGFWTLITIASLMAFFLSRKIDPRFFTGHPPNFSVPRDR